MRAMQKELEDLRREREQSSRRAREDDEELQILRERCERLEEERANGQGGVSFGPFFMGIIVLMQFYRRIQRSSTSFAWTWRAY